MDDLTNHAQRMLRIMDSRRDFYRSFGDEISDIASAVYLLIIRLQILESRMSDMRGDKNDT